MNEALFQFVNDGIKNPFLDVVLPVFSDKDYVVIPGVAALAILVYAGRRHARICVAALLLALLLSDTGSEKVLKNVFKAKRPYATLEGVHLHRGSEWVDYDPAWYPYDKRQSHSFPSSHAANAAALAVVLFFLSRKTLWATAPVAGLVGLSRMYTGNHYPLDVLGGFAWGALCGVGAVKVCGWVARRIWGETEQETAQAPPVPRDRRLFYWVLGGWTLMNFGFLHLNLFDLAGDEAQYWDWSRRLALGYYSKPPMIAYLMDALTGAGGNKEWALRSGAVLLSSGAVGLIYALALRIARSERAALLAALAALSMPASWAGSVLMTIDPLLVFFWVAAMYTFHRAVRGDRRMWVLTGLALGLGLLSKFTMVVLYAALFAYLVLVDRRWLRTKGPYVALAISLLCISGVFYWNGQHDWIAFRHTAAIGASEEGSIGRSLGQAGTFLAAQMGVVSPILFAFFAWAVARCVRRFRQNPDAAFLALCFGVLFVFYAVVSFVRKPEPNWPVAAYPAAAIALGWLWTEGRRGRLGRGLLVGGMVLGCLIGIAARATGLAYLMGGEPGPDRRADRLYLAGLTIDPDKDPTNGLRGGRELGEALRKYVGGTDAGPFLFSDRYQMTAWLAFYGPGRPRAYCFPYERRRNQYDLWGGWEELAGRDAIFVTGGDADKARLWTQGLVEAGVFAEGEYLETVEVRRGHTVVRRFTISKLRDYAGFDLTAGKRY